jgi:hypothetical protein
VLRGAVAGVVSAVAWAASEPALGRLFRTPYSDLRLLAGLTRRGPAVALAVHLANGAVFGAVFARIGWRGVARGVLAAETENLALWPAMAVADRLHPDRRSGAWPPLLRDGRVFAYELTTHAIFGAVLGVLLRHEPG